MDNHRIMYESMLFSFLEMSESFIFIEIAVIWLLQFRTLCHICCQIIHPIIIEYILTKGMEWPVSVY